MINLAATFRSPIDPIGDRFSVSNFSGHVRTGNHEKKLKLSELRPCSDRKPEKEAEIVRT
ncbi:MAG: hypothetical protein ACXVNF_13475 [Neobacillus sp.]